MLYGDAMQIINEAIAAAQPDTAVSRALENFSFDSGRVVLVAIGKAAWQMANRTCELLDNRIDCGVVITKYGHSKGPLPRIRIFEAGHPVPDSNSFLATDAAIEMTENLTEHDQVLFLVSGGGSALFEKPLVSPAVLETLTRQLLSCGADIVEINTVRKRLSAVKGGRFAEICAPAKVFTIVLSDIIGDPLDMIASGPAYPDSSTCEDALTVIQKYSIAIDKETEALLRRETPKALSNIETQVSGSVAQLCEVAEKTCRALGYEPHVLTTSLCCTARDAGSFLASIARYHSGSNRPLAFIAGGETVVRLEGTGMGGRNQEIALAAAIGIAELRDVAVFSIGSDGTDGPTDAAGGYADGATLSRLRERGMDAAAYLANNDSYTALGAVDALIKTGPTGTNVNDLSVVLIRR